MNPMIQSSIDPFLTGFDAYNIAGTPIEPKVQDFHNRLLKLAEGHDDVAAFFAEFASSGLQDEYGKLMLEAAQPPAPAQEGGAPAGQDGGATSGSASGSPISVQTFVEQYREPYNAVKAAGYRKRAEAAYEKIFAVPSQTENMLEAQMILERERLLYKIVSEDILDITEPIIEAMDPLQENMTFACQFLKEASLNSNDPEELHFNTVSSPMEVAKFVPIWNIKHVIIPTALALNLLIYLAKGKRWIWAWESDIAAQEGVANMVYARTKLRRILKFMKDNLNMSFEDVCNDEASKIWLLRGINVDELGKVKIAWSPDNLEAFKEIVNEEILSDMPIEQCLMREGKNEFQLSEVSSQGEAAYKAKAQAKADEVTADLTYYKYRSQLDKGFADITSK